MCHTLHPQVSLVVFSRVSCVVWVVHTYDTVSIAMAGKDNGWDLVHVVRPVVWGAMLRLPIFCCWSCHTPDHVHVDNSDVGFLQLYTLQRELLDELDLMRFPVCAIGVEQSHTLLDNAMFQQLGQIHTLTTRLITALRAVRPISTAVAMSSCPGFFVPASLRNVSRLLRGTDAWREVYFY